MDPRQNLKDYYYILGVSPEATREEIEEAFRLLSDKFGPHVTLRNEDPETMEKTYREICDAWEVLSDPTSRQQYDKNNLPLVQKSQLRSLWGKFTGSNDEDLKTKDSVSDLRIPLEISLKEAIKGTNKQIKLEDTLACQQCFRKKPVERAKCGSCFGSGMIRNERTETIVLPPGSYPQMELRLAGKGKFDTRVQKHGDLLVEIQIQPHPFFAVLGRDITCTVPVTVTEAVLGGEIDIPTASGRVVMKIQPLTQHGRVYRLKGLGIAGADLLVTVEVSLPLQISGDELTLFRKLHESSTQGNPRSEIFAKLSRLNQDKTEI
ncbi:MAG: DnaJ domain-containing protein [Candidatus Obscuribacterales bacterium]|nr:DnaJ domain-containing protein [Candidatus Obscuribacterales bacterium]